MKTQFFRGQGIIKIALVFLLAVLAAQGSGLDGLAAPAVPSVAFQESGDRLAWSCSCASYALQAVFLIDDSGSMDRNDPGARRIQDANRLVDDLLAPLGERAQVRGVQAAVVHFSNTSTPSPGWRTLPGEQTELGEDIDAIPADVRGTKFIEPFQAARNLFLQQDGDCTRRSIVLFSDGTPEYPSGQKIGGSELAADFNETLATLQGIPNLDAVYLIRYRGSPWYFNEEVSTGWASLANTYRLFSPSLGNAPRLRVIPSFPLQPLLDEIERAAAFEEDEALADASRYHLGVEFDGAGPLFRLADGSGLPAGDPGLQLGRLTQNGQEIAWTEEGDGYRFALSSGAAALSVSEIAASFTSTEADGAKEMLRCSGALGLQTVEIPVTGPGAGLSLVIMPPRDPLDPEKATILPMEVRSDQTIEDVQWSPESPDVRSEDGTPLEARIEPAGEEVAGANLREFNLVIAPVEEIDQFSVAVAGLAITGQGPVDIPRSGATIRMPAVQLACTYDPAWDFWFWPLAVLLAGLLAVLLVFRVVDAETQKDYQVVRSDDWRARKWRFLLLPTAILLGLLVLNPGWCYAIPWWMFLAAMPGMAVMVFPLVHFLEDESQRRWALLALLLVAAVLVLVVSFTIDRRLFWPLAAILLLTVIGRWYIRPDERPEGGREPGLPISISLALEPARQPEDGRVTVPVQLKYDGDQPWTSLHWDHVATDAASGEILRSAVSPESAGPGAYELAIDPARETREIRVQVSAVAGIADRLVGTPAANTTLSIPAQARDTLSDLEGIGPVTEKILNEHGIFTFVQLAQGDVAEMTGWLDQSELEMRDAKTWPQQARLADIAERYGLEADKQNYLAYTDWLKDGVEPDEYNADEAERRDTALPWNGIPQFTPLALSLPLNPANGHPDSAIRLPVQLNHAGDRVRLQSVEWKASAQALPGGQQVAATVQPVDAGQGRYEIAIDPGPGTGAQEIRLTVQASVKGRSIEIYYGKALTVQVSPPPGADDLSDLEGIEAATEKVLNAHGIYTYKQLAGADHRTINTWLDEAGQKMRDAKTWPQQARLADIAKKYGRDEDLRSYQAYKAWLKGGIEPDEYEKEEKDRRPLALAWPLAGGETPDPLEDLEGIGPAIAKMLNDYGVFTFKQLARADARQISAWLDDCGYERVDPKTWPQQAKLASIAREFGRDEDLRSYAAYKNWLKGGIEPDEYEHAERERRPAALVWYGTTELTQAAYPAIFKAQ